MVFVPKPMGHKFCAALLLLTLASAELRLPRSSLTGRGSHHGFKKDGRFPSMKGMVWIEPRPRCSLSIIDHPNGQMLRFPAHRVGCSTWVGGRRSAAEPICRVAPTVVTSRGKSKQATEVRRLEVRLEKLQRGRPRHWCAHYVVYSMASGWTCKVMSNGWQLLLCVCSQSESVRSFKIV